VNFERNKSKKNFSWLYIIIVKIVTIDKRFVVCIVNCNSLTDWLKTQREFKNHA